MAKPILSKRIASVLAFLTLMQTEGFAQTQSLLKPLIRGVSDTVLQPRIVSGTVRTLDGAALENALI